MQINWSVCYIALETFSSSVLYKFIGVLLFLKRVLQIGGRRGASETEVYLDSFCASWKVNVSKTQLIGLQRTERSGQGRSDGGYIGTYTPPNQSILIFYVVVLSP